MQIDFAMDKAGAYNYEPTTMSRRTGLCILFFEGIHYNGTFIVDSALSTFKTNLLQYSNMKNQVEIKNW